MCYALLLSTTSNDDLSRFNNEAIRFDKTIPERLSFDRFLYPNRWYVGSRTGCSCSFRHLYGPEFEFGVPEAWFPEEETDVQATLMFIHVVRSLLEKGESVDCIDLWEGHDMEPQPPISMNVNLSQIRDEAFRFFENHYFKFISG
jgi:hypothetical protein